MKFKQIVFIIILAALGAAYFTKPTKDQFMAYIQPSFSIKGAAPVIDYQDRFFYADITATYIYLTNPQGNGPTGAATGNQERYIGLFQKFWKTGR